MIWVKTSFSSSLAEKVHPLYRVPAPNTQQGTVRRTGAAHRATQCVDSRSKKVSPLHLSYWRRRNKTPQNNQRQTNAVSSTQGASSAETEIHCHNFDVLDYPPHQAAIEFRVQGTILIRGLTNPV